MYARTTIVASALLLAALTSCSSSESDKTDSKPNTDSAPTANTSPDASPADAHHYDSAQDIADALTAAGLTVSKPQEETAESYISKVGGTAYNFTVTDSGQASGDAGINMFPNAEALAAWVPLSKQFGGVAVTGDTWAVSLPTDGQARDDSKRLAPRIAEALDGAVQQ